MNNMPRRLAHTNSVEGGREGGWDNETTTTATSTRSRTRGHGWQKKGGTRHVLTGRLGRLD